MHETLAAISDDAFAVVELSTTRDEGGALTVFGQYCEISGMAPAPLRDVAAVLRSVAEDLERQAADLDAGGRDGS